MKRFLLVTAALVAAVAVLIVLTMPPRRLELAPAADGSVRGILHVHTNRSDGRSSPDEVAAAAARAGLAFVVFTDHGDATRPPDAPAYRAGVLCIDGVEISTTGGHYVVLDMPAAPYPLAGEPRDVVEDVRRLGGFGIAAHPDSPKPELRWQAWDSPFDGVELMNPDTSWRLWAQQAASSAGEAAGNRWRARRRLAVSLLDYAFRPAETIAGLMGLEAQQSAARKWAELVARRRIVALAGIDAHAMIAPRGDPGDNGVSLPLPGYEASFRVMSVHVTPDKPLSGAADADAAAIVSALRKGHLYVAVDGIATPPSLEFTASTSRGTVQQGDEVPASGPVPLRVRTNMPPEFTTTIFSSTGPFGVDHREPQFTVDVPGTPNAYWVEVRSTGRAEPQTWIRSNPIYVGGSAEPVQHAAPRTTTVSQTLFDGKSVATWRIEHDALSVGAIEVVPGLNASEALFRFGLAGGAATGQFSALVYDLPSNNPSADRLTFTARAERPMRISVQLRGGEGVVDRWQRSVYLDTTPQEHTILFDDCQPVGVTHTPRAPARSIRSIMFVVDTTNSKPGAMGRVWLRTATLQR